MAGLATRTDTSRPRHADLIEVWRHSLTQDDHSDPTDVVVAELSAYFQMQPDEVRERCINWKKYSVAEWSAKDRTTTEGLLDFYQTQVSWIFDTMWYHAKQYHATNFPESVAIAEALPSGFIGDHLDFGAGPGSTSLFFAELGWRTSLADISTTMLDFAKWRFACHHVPAAFYELPAQTLPTGAFDLITALDVMAHVPNPSETLHTLHRALKPGGYLIFNIDSRPRSATTAWHLYDDQYPILRQVRRVGFCRQPKISFLHVYRKIERSPISTKAIDVFDSLRYNKAIQPLIGYARRRLRPNNS